MKTDRFELQVSTDKQSVIDALNHFSTQLLQNGQEAGKIFDAVKIEPDNLLLNCHSGVLFLYTHDDQDTAKCLPYLQTAERLLAKSNERENLFYQAAKAWYQKDHFAALSLYEKITSNWPRDCVAAKFAEWIFYCMGQKPQADRFLRMTTPMYEYNKNEPGFLATHSFALELAGRTDESQGIAQDALIIEPLTPWAHHTIAHALLSESKIDRGIELLETYKPSWQKILPLLSGHLNWHLNLFYLANLDEKNILTRFSPDVWGNSPEISLEQIDAIALLWRMEMAGMPQDDLLKKVTAKLGQHVYQHYIGFDTAHYVYALSRGGHKKDAQKIISDATHYAQALAPNYRDLWLNICIPLFKGINAFGEENYQEAITHFEPVLSTLAQIGGSDAQIEMFHQAAALSLLRTGQKDKAYALIKHYLPYYIPTQLGQHWSTL